MADILAYVVYAAFGVVIVLIVVYPAKGGTATSHKHVVVDRLQAFAALIAPAALIVVSAFAIDRWDAITEAYRAMFPSEQWGCRLDDSNYVVLDKEPTEAWVTDVHGTRYPTERFERCENLTPPRRWPASASNE